MARLSAIEKWFYGLTYLEAVDDLGYSRTKKNSFKHSETSSTSTFTLGRGMSGAMGVKMVADELLAATGTVVGATLGFFLFSAVPHRGPLKILSSAKLGEEAGRKVGEVLYSASHWVHNPNPFSAHDRTARRMKQADWRIG